MGLVRSQIRAKLYDRVDGLGFAGTSDSNTASTLTDTERLLNDELGAGEYIGTHIYWPAKTNEDRVKPSGELAPLTGVLTQIGSDWADTTGTRSYEIVGLIHPDELNDVIRRAMYRIWLPFVTALSPWQDGDFNGSTNPFTAQDSGTTSAKSALAANNDSGLNALLVPDSGSSGGYTEAVAIDVEPGDKLLHGAVVKVNTAGASAKYQLMDKTNAAIIGSAFTVSSRRFQAIMAVDTVPEGCYSIAPRLITVTASATSCWDTLFGHFRASRRLPAPDWLDAVSRLNYLTEARYSAALETGRYNAFTKRYEPWDRPADYDLEPLSENPTPRTIVITRDEDDLPEWPLWVHGRRQASDFDAMDDETDETDQPEELVMAAVMAELGELLWSKYKTDEYRVMWQENEAELQGQQQARPAKTQPKKETTMYTPGGRR